MLPAAVSRRIALSCSMFATGLVLLAGCSIGPEESSRTWSNWDRFEEPTETAQPGLSRIFLVDGRQNGTPEGAMMTSVSRELPTNTAPYRALLEALFKGPTSEEAARGLKSSLPVDITVEPEPTMEQSGILVIDLSAQLTTALGDELTNALAQIVWTLCERPEIRQVRILVEGRRLPWTRSDGTVLERPLTPFDFPAFAIASQPDFPGIIQPPSAN